MLLVSGAPGAVGSPASAPGGNVRVIVVSPGSGKHAKDNVNAHNGSVAADLSIIDGVAADLSPADLANLQQDPSVVVVPDAPVSIAAASDLTGSTRAPAAVFPATTGAAVTNSSMGLNGQGVTVAVLDTGITKLPDFAGRVVGGVDLSGEGDPFMDSYGHGTFVSGLIAGNGASSNGQYVGEAPKASLASIKIAGASGVTDLATVISGVQWAVNNQKALNIGVLNISLGAVPFPSSVLNPLDQAVEKAWQSGIVVVASTTYWPFDDAPLAAMRPLTNVPWP